MSARVLRSDVVQSRHGVQEEATQKAALAAEQDKINKMTDIELKNQLTTVFTKKYKTQPRDLQVEAAFNLIRGKDTFLLACTGYGKTRIAELFYLFAQRTINPVVLVINPLDALGDNQVLEKEMVGFKSINLTKMTFTKSVARKVEKGAYHFVYLSPEVFVNNRAFGELYFSERFQQRLVMKVVDEAHLIYKWGLVESGQARRSSAHAKLQDTGTFRPSYGSLSRQLMATQNVPLLLMSATCPPVAIRMILANLRILKEHITIIRGELTRPEIRILRVPMRASLAGAEDVRRLCAHRDLVPDDQIPPGLIYSGSRNGTSMVLKELSISRGSPNEAMNGQSSFARRYHSLSGKETKRVRAEAYANGDFPVMSCTMALGLGQNWSRVNWVAHLGRGDPSAILQEIGRCGRDGRAGLGIVFVEKVRRGGKNLVEDFKGTGEQSEDDRMDAFAITPCCLRVALALDNRLGLIPLRVDDPKYLEERKRELEAGFTRCLCSNCEPRAGDTLFENFPKLNRDSFHRAVQGQLDFSAITIPVPTPTESAGEEHQPWKVLRCGARDALRRNDEAISLVKQLQEDFKTLFASVYPLDYDIAPEDIFTMEDGWQLAKNAHSIRNELMVRQIIGSELLPGSLRVIFATLQLWKGCHPQQKEAGSTRKRPRAEETNSARVATGSHSKRHENNSTIAAGPNAGGSWLANQKAIFLSQKRKDAGSNN